MTQSQLSSSIMFNPQLQSFVHQPPFSHPPFSQTPFSQPPPSITSSHTSYKLCDSPQPSVQNYPYPYLNNLSHEILFHLFLRHTLSQNPQQPSQPILQMMPLYHLMLSPNSVMYFYIFEHTHSPETVLAHLCARVTFQFGPQPLELRHLQPSNPKINFEATLSFAEATAGEKDCFDLSLDSQSQTRIIRYFRVRRVW